MAKVWEYNGYTIDEGLKPRDENYKADYYQYFFIVKKAEQRLMKQRASQMGKPVHASLAKFSRAAKAVSSQTRTATAPAASSLSPATSMNGIFCNCASRILACIRSLRESTSTRKPAALS